MTASSSLSRGQAGVHARAEQRTRAARRAAASARRRLGGAELERSRLPAVLRRSGVAAASARQRRAAGAFARPSPRAFAAGGGFAGAAPSLPAPSRPAPSPPVPSRAGAFAAGAFARRRLRDAEPPCGRGRAGAPQRRVARRALDRDRGT